MPEFSGDHMGYDGVSVSGQLQVFGLSVLLGVGLGLVYEVFRLLRLAFFSQKTVVFVQDVLFSLTALVSTFVFVVAVNEGQLRFFLLIGELCGFTVYYFTLGALIFHLSSLIIGTVRKMLSFLLSPLKKALDRRASKKESRKNKKIQKKITLFFKNHLQRTKQM